MRRPCRIRVPHRPNVEDAVWRIYLLRRSRQGGRPSCISAEQWTACPNQAIFERGPLTRPPGARRPCSERPRSRDCIFMLSEMDSAQFKEKTQNEALPEISEEPLKEAEAKRLNARENEDNTVQPTPDQETKRTNALTGPQENAFVRFSNTDDAPAAQPTIAAAAQHNASQRTKYSPKTLLNGRFIRGEKGEYH